MTRRPYEVQKGIAGWSTALPVNDEGNATLTLDDALAGVFECVTATSSPAGTVEGKTAGGVWTQIESYQYTSGTYTRRAAGATVTLATGDLLYVPAPGFTHVRFKRASGTSMTWTARTLEGIDAVLLIRLLVSGLTASVTFPDAVVGPSDPVIDSYTKVAINLAAGANQSLVTAPGSNKQIWVYGYNIMVNAAGTVSFQDEDDTALSGIMPVSTGIVVSPSGNFAMPIWKLATNKALEVDVVTSELDGWLAYAIVSV